MPTVTIREVDGDEILSTARVVADYAFGTSPSKPADIEEHRRRLQFRGNARTLVAFADEQPLATATLYPMMQNVRGALLPMGGVAAVASLPAARRLGHVRRVFIDLYAAMHEAGMPVTALYPFRASFYERFGYTGFAAPRFATFDPADLGQLARMEKPGRVELLSMTDGFDAWRAFLSEYQQSAHGFSLR
jgi:predicted acetyltransferase